MATKTELAYIAGFVDGEGSIWSTRSPKTGTISVGVTIKQKYPEILHWIRDTMGYGNVTTNGPNAWNLHIGNKHDVRAFLVATAPYLRVKYEQSMLALDMLTLMPGHRERISAHDREHLDSMRLRLAAMKKQGAIVV